MSHFDALTSSLKIIVILEDQGFESRLVGGCVRDRLMKRTPKDYDIATQAKPEEVMAIFATLKNYKLIPVGLEFGTVGVFDSKNRTLLEVTTLRKDVSTDGRRAVVEFTKDFKEDAERRDFTINAMYEDKSGKIYDFFEGLTHLKTHRLMFVGNPAERIKEDYLRILRFFRFLAQLNFIPDSASFQAIKPLRKGLATISAERITQELQGIFECESPGDVWDMLLSSGVLPMILNEEGFFDNPKIIQSMKPYFKMQVGPQEHRFLFRLGAILFRAQPKNCTFSRLSLPKVFAKKLETLATIENHLGFFSRDLSGSFEVTGLRPSTSELMEFLDKIEKNMHGDLDGFFAFGKLVLTQGPLQVLKQLEDCELQSKTLRKASIPLNGHDLSKNLGLKGANLGRALQQLKNDFRDGLWQTKEEGLQLLQTHQGKGRLDSKS